jgi:hypothetical protein
MFLFITRRLTGDALRRTLLHEMCRVAATCERKSYGPTSFNALRAWELPDYLIELDADVRRAMNAA